MDIKFISELNFEVSVDCDREFVVDGYSQGMATAFNVYLVNNGTAIDITSLLSQKQYDYIESEVERYYAGVDETLNSDCD